MIPGFEKRLEENLHTHLPKLGLPIEDDEALFRVIAPEDRIHDVVLGGCYLTTMIESQKKQLLLNDEKTLNAKAKGRFGWAAQSFKEMLSPGKLV